MKTKRPNWDNSILNVTASILHNFGYDSSSKTNPLVDEVLQKNYKNIILLLLDGLGSENLQELSPKGILSQHKKAVISSTFPSTTVAAISSLESGTAPIAHGWLGWSLYFKEFARNIDIFPYRDSITKEAIPLGERSGKDILQYKTIYEKINQVNNNQVGLYALHPDTIVHVAAGCNNLAYRDIKDMFGQINDICQLEGQKYIYAYSANPDYDMHEFGSKAPEVKQDIVDIEGELGKLLENLTDTVVIVMADHGHIDVEWIYLNEIPGMLDCLKKFPTIESRAKNIALKEGKEKDFLQLYAQYLANDFLLLSKEELLDQHYFGYGSKHYKFDDFIDDYMLVATSNKALGYETLKEGEFLMKSAHAGLTVREMTVPLVIIEKQRRRK